MSDIKENLSKLTYDLEKSDYTVLLSEGSGLKLEIYNGNETFSFTLTVHIAESAQYFDSELLVKNSNNTTYLYNGSERNLAEAEFEINDIKHMIHAVTAGNYKIVSMRTMLFWHNTYMRIYTQQSFQDLLMLHRKKSA